MTSVADKKITVLYVDEAVAHGGSLVVIANLVDTLDKSKYRPVMVGELDEKLLPYAIQSNCRVYIIPRMFNYVKWARTMELIQRIPGRILRKSINYLLSIIRGFLNSGYVIRLVRVLVHERVDIIHVNNGMNNLAPVLVSVFMRKKFLVHFHGMENPGFIQRQLMSRVPIFIAISEYLKRGLVENGYSCDKVLVMHNPVLPKAVSAGNIEKLRVHHGIRDSDKVVGIVGRIIRWKGHIEFLEAVSIVVKTLPGVKVLIVGDFSSVDALYRQEISKLIDDHDLNDRVIFTGHAENVDEFYSLMDVCVHASIEPEPFGLVITEAMSYGVPVVASNRGAPSEIIHDGDDGYLVDPEDTIVFAGRISRLLTNEDLRLSMGMKGRERVLKDFPVDKYSENMQKVYSGIMNNMPGKLLN